MSNNDSSVKNPIEMGSLANTVIRKSRCLSKPVDMFVCRYSLSLTWALNSLRLRKNVITIQWNSAMNSTLDISLFICYLFMMHSQGLLHFPSHGINFNHDSWNSFLSNHNSQSTQKKQNTGSQKYLCSLLWEWFTCENNDIIPKGSLWIHSLTTINIIKTR